MDAELLAEILKTLREAGWRIEPPSPTNPARVLTVNTGKQ